nr:undecaprenyl-diphosphate phosphatase [Sulfobacillus harzensis]
MGLIQGIAELFPLSSLGILVILPHITSLTVPTSGARYLPFLVALHLGTALALFVYFFAEWRRLFKGFIAWIRGRRTTDGRLFWMVVWATIPAGLVGLVLKHRLSALFGRPVLAAAFLVINGLIMLVGDRWHTRMHKDLRLRDLSVGQALKVGLFQVLALIPGLSRSGSTITGGVGLGLRYEDAARFSFLMATPIILAAGLVEIPKLSHGGTHGLMMPSLIGGMVAALVAWLSTHFLMRYFEHHRLRVFAFVSMALGVLGLALIH